MEDNKSETSQVPGKNSDQGENKDQEILPVHNPLNPDDPRQITQEDIENEQKYKEALTERD